MPTYVYRREDGSTFEIQQRITEPALKTCPTTGQPVTRLITGGTGLIFKGSGFYLTDYARKNSSPAGNGKASSNGKPSSNGKDSPGGKATENTKSTTASSDD